MIGIPDRYKHAGILGVTACLPKQLRVSARRRLLSGLQLAKGRRADVLMIVHPKAGGTWLRVMMFRLYQTKYHLPPRRVVKSDEMYNAQPTLPRFLITNGHYSYERAIEPLFDAGPRALEGKKVLMLARDPRDVAVSWYLQFTKRTKAFKRELILDEMKEPVRREEISMWDFVMHRELGLPALIEYLNGWQRRLARVSDSLIVRYEDLRQAPEATLARVMSFLGEECSDAAIADAVAFASFDNLKELERQNYFSNTGLRLRNANDPDTFKVRRGKVNGYRDYFDQDQLAQMDAMVLDRLSPEFGYGADDPAVVQAAVS